MSYLYDNVYICDISKNVAFPTLFLYKVRLFKIRRKTYAKTSRAPELAGDDAEIVSEIR